MDKIFSIINNVLGGGVGQVLDKFFPDKAEKLNFEIQLRETLFKELELVYKDVESARTMQTEALKQDDKFSKRFVYILSALVMFNTLLAGSLAFFVVFPMENKELISQYYNFSFLIGGAQMMRFFYGDMKSKNS
jgi:hypothetical protein